MISKALLFSAFSSFIFGVSSNMLCGICAEKFRFLRSLNIKKMMRRLFSTTVISLLCFAAFAQADIPQRCFVSAGNTFDGISHTIGQNFNFHAPDDSITLVAEGIEQAYAIDAIDTVILLSSEMDPYVPGHNQVYTSSFEGYDSITQLQVYRMDCPQDFDTTMEVSGQATCHINLTGDNVPTITPADPVVIVTSSPVNPYDYPVGQTTVTTWTAAVAGKTNACNQNVTVHYYNCTVHSPIRDVDGFAYPVVNLGYYCWTGKNLRTVHYSNGTQSIPDVMTYPASYAPGVPDLLDSVGHLYTWNAATDYNNTGTFVQGICPNGWHIPDEVETEYLLALFEARELMSNSAQIRWVPDNGTDNYDFTFLPAGYYNAALNRYEGLFVKSYFWTTETDGSTIANACEFGSTCGTIEIVPGDRRNGYSVRCVMDYIP